MRILSCKQMQQASAITPLQELLASRRCTAELLSHMLMTSGRSSEKAAQWSGGRLLYQDICMTSQREILT